MKKVLLASTALVFSAGFAAADVSLGGSANFGLKYNDNSAANESTDGAADGDDLVLHYEIDFGISGSGTTDSGLAFGASIDLDAEIDNGPLDDGGGSDPSTNDVKDPEVFISGSFGTLTVGDLDIAPDATGIADIGFDGIGIDDAAEAGRTLDSGSANVSYTYSFGDVAFTATYHTVDEDLGLLVSYAGDQFNVSLAYAEDGEADEDAITLNGGVSFGDVSVNAIYVDNSVSDQAYGFDVQWSAGATSVTFAYGDNDADDDASYGIGASYDLGGGASLAGGIGSANGNTVADLGINMSF